MKAATSTSPAGVQDWVAWLRTHANASRLRLVSGLWLFFYATTHLINHALGLVSLEAIERGRLVFLAFWRVPWIEASLLLALLVHVALSLSVLWQRRTLRLTLAEACQLVLGLTIPVLLTGHVLSTGWMHRCCGVTDSYAYVLNNVWPDGGVRYAVMTLVVWVHGVLGVHYWLRLKPGYRFVRPWLLVAATMLPVLALTGFVTAGRDVDETRRLDPIAWAERARSEAWLPTTARHRLTEAPEAWILRGFFGSVALLLVLRGVRTLWLRRRRVTLIYPGGQEVSVPRGLSVLETSILHGIPHASVCGGHGRCSTCRVRVGRGREHLPHPSPAERRVLARIGAPPDVRLACQLRPTATLAVTPLMPVTATARDVLRPMHPALGTEREIVVMFCDLRGFTRLAEGRLPYDIVFLLNRYFAVMGQAIAAAGGRVDKFIGDGIMALFGLAEPPRAAAHAALAAARDMADALVQLNDELAVELDEPLRVGIGLHAGYAILGEMGHGGSRALTAIGDAVNVASRLEALCKELDCQLLASDSVAALAPEVLANFPRRELDLRGRSERIGVRLVTDARELRLPPAAPESAPRLSSLGWWTRLTRPPVEGAKSKEATPISRSNSPA